MIDSEIFDNLYVNYEVFAKKDDAINWQYLHWLNTPGPVFTGHTDNIGMWPPDIMESIIADYDYHEAIFRQPRTKADFEIILQADSNEPCDGYSYVGVKFWSFEKIKFWWSFTEDIASHIQGLLERELAYGTDDPHKSLWDLGGEIKELHLYGPTKAIPENYKNWLEYYHSGELMRDVQTFAYILENKKLPNPNQHLPSLQNVHQQPLSLEMIEKRLLFLDK